MNYRTEIARLEAWAVLEDKRQKRQDRKIAALEKRAAALEQATLELAALARLVSPEGLGSLPSPSGESLVRAED